MDIDRAFRKHMVALADDLISAAVPSTGTSPEPPTSAGEILAEMRRIKAELGPPPPKVRLSKHVPALVEARPTAQPFTDDMRAMVDDIGPQRVSGGYRVGETILVNPTHFKEG